MGIQEVQIYSKGIADPGNGMAGIAAVLVCRGVSKVVSQRVKAADGVDSEIHAAILGLNTLTSPCSVQVYVNSKDMVDIGKIVTNPRDFHSKEFILQALEAAISKHAVAFVHADDSLDQDETDKWLSQAIDRARWEMLQMRMQLSVDGIAGGL